MPKIAQWKKILGHAEKEKVRVSVGPKVEEMTVTQSYRFDQLSKTWKAESVPVENPLEQSRYTLTEAAFRLQQDETRILEKAVAGAVLVYVNAAGLQGYWRRGVTADDASQTSLQTLVSGYLALTAQSCRGLLTGGGAKVSILEFLCPQDRTASDFDPQQLAALEAWGDGRKFFCLPEPLYVEPENLVLMAPLTGTT